VRLWEGCPPVLLAHQVEQLADPMPLLHRDAHEIAVREAGLMTAVWVSLALGFGGVLWWWQGAEMAGLYVTGYAVEWSLS
jgi:tellurite resistance protein TerC